HHLFGLRLEFQVLPGPYQRIDDPLPALLVELLPILHHRPDAESIGPKILLGGWCSLDFFELRLPPAVCGSGASFLRLRHAKLTAGDNVYLAFVFLEPAPGGRLPGHVEFQSQSKGPLLTTNAARSLYAHAALGQGVC